MVIRNLIPFFIALAVALDSCAPKFEGASIEASGILTRAEVLAVEDSEEEPTDQWTYSVVREGRLVASGWYRRGGSLVPRRRVFAIGSLTKTLTAIIVGLLMGEGRLRLDAPLSDYLPMARHRDPRIAAITIRMLLCHSSGLPDYSGDVFMRHHRTPVSRDSAGIIDELLQAPLNFEPGSRYAYSNSNYLILGRIIERLTGSTFIAAARSRLSSALADSESGQGFWWDGITFAPSKHPDLALAAGAGGIATDSTTLAELLDRNLTDGILPQTYRRQMLASEAYQIDGVGFGLFSNRQSLRGDRWNEGIIEGYHCALIYNPTLKLTVVVLTDTETANPLRMSRALAAIAIRRLKLNVRRG